MATLEATFSTADATAPGHYGSSRTALLLLDFHSLFVHHVGGPKAREALQVAAKLRTWAKSQGILVIHALNDINSTPFSTCKNGDQFAAVMGAMKASGGEECAELLEGDSGEDVFFTRRVGYVSALKSPGLDELLRKKGIKSLILTGLSTSGCVLSTAVTASDAEYVVSVISDGCADMVDEIHDVVVEKLLGNRGYVATAAEFQEGFVKASGGQ